MNNLLTIVIPVYNTDVYLLERCLRSLCKYAYYLEDDLDILIIDDCSNRYLVSDELKSLKDKSQDLCDVINFSKVIRLDKNMGLGFARNTAIKECKLMRSKYILFLDSDDELYFNPKILDISGMESNSKLIYSYGIDLINKETVINENCKKYLELGMIPYFITPNIYDVNYLHDSNFYFDESRRIFEDISFSVKVWSDILINDKESKVLFSSDPIYKYHLDNNGSLTRNDKLDRMINDLMYWINWIKDYYKGINSDEGKKIIKPKLFNRIRYEATKILSMKMSVNNDSEKYIDILNLIKPYNIDKVL